MRVLVVGGGKMGLQHARAIELSDIEARLVGIVDASAAVRSEVAGRIPGAPAFADLQEALAEARPDVVHICTPAATHVALAEMAVSSGCHAYVEKPFALDVEGAERVLDVARECGVRVTAGHQLLLQRATDVVARQVGAIGPVVHLESYFAFRPSRGGDAPLGAVDQLVDVLPHPTYVLLHFLLLAAPASAWGEPVIEVGPGPTVHAVLSRGDVRGLLTVTLSGRPVESFVKLVGENGSVTADYVRDSTLRLVGPGSSAIDKAAAPYRSALQLVGGTSRALWRRLRRSDPGYPGLRENIEAFYLSIRDGSPGPVPEENIIETTRVVESVARTLEDSQPVGLTVVDRTERLRVLVTGGTGLLGRELCAALVDAGAGVTAIARRRPPPWDVERSVDYVAADLADGLPAGTLADQDVVIHCAAATAGGFDAHERHSVQATERLLTACAEAGVRRLIFVSSMAVLARPGRRQQITETSPTEPDSRAAGPYVWGKLESERRAVDLGRELGIQVTVVRPGPILETKLVELPGRVGKRLAGIAVAVGGRDERVPAVRLDFAASILCWLALHPDEAPPVLNLTDPHPMTREAIVAEFRANNPGVRVLWIPRFLIPPLSWLASGAQRVARRGRRPISLATIFADRPVDGSLVRRLDELSRSSPLPSPTSPPSQANARAIGAVGPRVDQA